MPNGNVINYEYDYSGNLIKETNSLIEYPTENVYDPKGRLKKTIAKTTDGVSSVTEYKYDALDRLIKESRGRALNARLQNRFVNKICTSHVNMRYSYIFA